MALFKVRETRAAREQHTQGRDEIGVERKKGQIGRVFGQSWPSVTGDYVSHIDESIQKSATCLRRNLILRFVGRMIIKLRIP